MPITPILLITLVLAVALGWVGRGLVKPKKRVMPPNGSALQQQPEAVWGNWTPEIGRAIGGRRDA
jgi:hypothetical protein